jgi:hypothetical protein
MEDKVLVAVLTLGSVAHYSGSPIQGPLSDPLHIVLTGGFPMGNSFLVTNKLGFGYWRGISTI